MSLKTGGFKAACVLTAIIFVGAAIAEETVIESSENLKLVAAQYEQAGALDDAAAAYERLIVLDPSTRSVVIPHLVGLYVGLKQSEPALRWAREHMASTPDPVAYLAEVQARLGLHAEAIGTLEAEAGKESELPRKLFLMWQLADVCMQAGQTGAASNHLAQAVTLAAGTPYSKTAHKRLDEFGGVRPAK